MSETLFYSIFVFLFGALQGSFANVVIYRYPKKLSVVTPRSHCYSCQKLVAWYDNIPIFSWFVLRGKCRSCAAPFSIRYPLVELMTGLIFLFTYFKFGIGFTFFELILFSLCLIIVSFIDIDNFLLPDIFTLSGIVFGFAGSFFSDQRTWLDSLLGILFGGGTLWAIAYLYFVFRKEEGMGGGDIKLLAWIGAVLGWKALPFVIMTASILGSVVGFYLILFKKKEMKTAIPFGPYLALGAVLYFLIGQSLGQMYIQLFLPDLV